MDSYPINVRVTRAEVALRSEEFGECNYCSKRGLPRVAWFLLSTDKPGSPYRMKGLPGFACSRHAARLASDTLFAQEGE